MKANKPKILFVGGLVAMGVDARMQNKTWVKILTVIFAVSTALALTLLIGTKKGTFNVGHGGIPLLTILVSLPLEAILGLLAIPAALLLRTISNVSPRWTLTMMVLLAASIIITTWCVLIAFRYI